MHSPKISVIIPVFNVKDYVERCIWSITQNSYRNLEIICINDGSTDGSLEILQKWASLDERIVVIDKPNGGVTSARNAGLDAATGSWVSFIDSDDWIHHHFFEVMLREQQRAGDMAHVVICGFERTSAFTDDEPVTDTPTTKMLSWHDIASGFVETWTLWGKLYKRELLDNIRLPKDLTYGEDITTNLLALGNMDECKALRINANMYKYYIRQGSAIFQLPLSKQLDSYIYFSGKISQIVSREARKEFGSIVTNEFITIFALESDLPRTQRERSLAACKRLMSERQALGFASWKEWLWFSRQWMFARFPHLARLYYSWRSEPFRRRLKEKKQHGKG